MRPPHDSPSAPPKSSAYSTLMLRATIARLRAAVCSPGSPVTSAASGSGAPSVCSTSYLGIPQTGQLATWSTCIGISNEPDDHFAPIDVRLLRASELEARAAASLNRMPQPFKKAVQDTRSLSVNASYRFSRVNGLVVPRSQPPLSAAVALADRQRFRPCARVPKRTDTRQQLPHARCVGS